MSNLSNKTEKKALNVLANCMAAMEALAYLDMTASDDFDATQAKNQITGIIQSNARPADASRTGLSHQLWFRQKPD